jgi:N-formylglutamate amidohydrolase
MSHQKLPFVFSAPHCSNRIPAEIRKSLNLSDQEIEESTDIGTLEIFGTLPASAVFCASWSRLVVDLNRAPDQRDRKGVVAHIDYSGRNIYRPESLPGKEEVERRLRVYYNPYHRQLRGALDSNEIAGLIDCHSLFAIGPPEAPDPGEKRKDIVLSNNGDLQGFARPGSGPTTCPAERLKLAKAVFEESGFSVSLNRPYAGGYITTHYGHSLSKKGKMGLQMEINQDLYCATGTILPAPDKVEEVRERILIAFVQLGRLMREC